MPKPNPMPNFAEMNIEITRNSYNVAEPFKTWAVEDIRAYQAAISKPWHVMCLNVTGDLNLGVIARSASAFGATSLWAVGRRKFDKRSFVGCENYFAINKVDGLLEDLTIDPNVVKLILDENNLVPIFIEQDGLSLGEFDWAERVHPIYRNDRYRDDIPAMPVFVFGNEGLGISDEILALGANYEGSFKVSIDQIGVTRSLNVASAATTVMWDFSRALGFLRR